MGGMAEVVELIRQSRRRADQPYCAAGRIRAGRACQAPACHAPAWTQMLDAWDAFGQRWVVEHDDLLKAVVLLGEMVGVDWEDG